MIFNKNMIPRLLIIYYDRSNFIHKYCLKLYLKVTDMNNRKFLVSMTALVAALATESTLANTDTSSQVNLAVSSQGVEANKGISQFNFIPKTADSQAVMAYHSSHASHASHASHSSHNSHYSSYE